MYYDTCDMTILEILLSASFKKLFMHVWI